MKSISLLFSFVLAVTINPNLAAQENTSSYDGETSAIEIVLDMTGSRTALKIDEEKCQFGFPLLVEEPALDVFDESGDLVSSTSLGLGDRSEVDGKLICSMTYEVDVPANGSFRVDIAPYFTREFSPKDIENESLEIDIIREDGAPFPIPPIPVGGPIEGTGKVRIVGQFELRGTNYEDFMNSPILGCTGMGGYRDVQAGMQITVKDESGTIIGVAELQPDATEDMPEDCRFFFTAEVPAFTFYTF